MWKFSPSINYSISLVLFFYIRPFEVLKYSLTSGGITNYVFSKGKNNSRSFVHSWRHCEMCQGCQVELEVIREEKGHSSKSMALLHSGVSQYELFYFSQGFRFLRGHNVFFSITTRYLANYPQVSTENRTQDKQRSGFYLRPPLRFCGTIRRSILHYVDAWLGLKGSLFL
jgi:hypothetical protein